MQFTEPLEFWDATIGRVSLTMKDGKVSSRIQVKAQLTPELAKVLGCQDLVYLKNGTPRQAFEEISLQGGCASCRAVLEVDGLKQSLEIDADEVSDILIDRSKDGLRISFRLNYSGDALTVVNHWMQVGSAPGICKVTPLQAELKATDDVKATITSTRRSPAGGCGASRSGLDLVGAFVRTGQAADREDEVRAASMPVDGSLPVGRSGHR